MGTVAVYDADYSSAAEVIEKAFSDFGVNLENKNVVIKPNVIGPFGVSRAITTHPSVVAGVVKAVAARRPARIVVGDNPGVRGYGLNKTSAQRSGLLDVCSDYYVNLSEEGVSAPMKSRFTDKVTISRTFLETDFYISIPKFKTHMLTHITGAIKNSFGMLVGGQKTAIHRLAQSCETFSEALVDIYQLRAPDLVVMDAVIGMEGKGPSSEDLREIGKIIVSDNGVELDAVMAVMMGMDPVRVPMLQLAQERGLGRISLGSIKTVGPIAQIENFKLPSKMMRGPVGFILWHLLTHLMTSRPVPIEDKCSKCGICEQHCPVGAIQLKPYPTVNPERCISCFCCMELCPNSALDVTNKVKRYRGRFKY
ncbi:MAG: DUF362 domain-containing protein [Candidatus Abyssobacteria bacterium SURF_5]|uniref:DUF362 domain-containing protein n=1 Tax=Abyssobacteria bacterium (strain SURF_5) TaxID=2093360 RepID=A0A3A4N562_ABYX5|nr:MAG: DUF362 domain-containing protein [Candidatus Abyssubacteria bacterium SURF_5]